MKRAAGQAARFVHALLGLCLLALAGFGVAAWRLADRPVELDFLLPRLQAEVAAASDGRLQVAIGGASLAWAGFREGHRSPLELRLSSVRAQMAGGAAQVSLPDAALSLSLGPLLRGRLTIRQVELLAPALSLLRDAEGRLRLEADAAEAGEPTDWPALVAALPAIRVRDGRLTLRDAASGRAWHAEHLDLVLQRREDGHALSGTLRLQAGEAAIPLRLAGRFGPAGGEASLDVPGFAPALLAPLAPELAPLAGLAAPAALTLRARLDATGGLAGAEADLALDRGEASWRGSRVAFDSLTARLTLAGGEARLEEAVLRLPGAGPVLRATGAAGPVEAGHAGRLDLTLDRVDAAALAAHWPAALAPGARRWVSENVTAGEAREGRWRFAFAAPADLSAVRLSDVSGRVAVSGVTAHWLRPVPPAEAASGEIVFAREGLAIELSGGRQQGTGLALRGGRVEISGFDQPVEDLALSLDVEGPVADLLGLIAHPRFNLFRNRPLDIREPGGRLEGRLAMSFPMLRELPIERVTLRAEGRVSEGRIANAALGRPLERAALALEVTMAGLRAEGQGVLGDIPLRLVFETDFRPGPPTQVIERLRAEGRAEWPRIAALGFPPPGPAEGTASVVVAYEKRRNGQSVAALRGDLRDSRLSLPALAWNKARGAPGTLEASLRFTGGQLGAIEGVRLDSAGLLLRGRLAFTQGAFVRAEIAEGRLGDSRFAGTLDAPAQPGAAWRLAANGPLLDLAPILAAQEGGSGSASDGPQIELRGRFERVRLGEGRHLHGVDAEARLGAAGEVQQARIGGRSQPQGGAFQLGIVPAAGGRRDFTLETEDGGALLRAFDVLRDIEGGRLSVRAHWARIGAPLAGEAVMDGFAVNNAPAFGKLLQAITVYGLIDALSGQGLNFARAVLPFELSPEALVLGPSRAFSVSLGFTAQGRIERRANRINLEGTVVPAYILNTVLGRIPLIGGLFSAERGGGLFAVSWRMTGALNDPQVSVNPLSALTPGFLRGIFGGGTN